MKWNELKWNNFQLQANLARSAASHRCGTFSVTSLVTLTFDRLTLKLMRVITRGVANKFLPNFGVSWSLEHSYSTQLPVELSWVELSWVELGWTRAVGMAVVIALRLYQAYVFPVLMYGCVKHGPHDEVRLWPSQLVWHVGRSLDNNNNNNKKLL